MILQNILQKLITNSTSLNFHTYHYSKLKFTYVCTRDIKISVFTSITIPTSDIMFTATISSQTVTNWQLCLIVYICTKRIALTWLAARRITRSFDCESITKESLSTSFTIESIGVVNTSQTLSSVCVTITDCTWVNIVITVAFLTRPYSIASFASWISEVSIFAFFTSRT